MKKNVIRINESQLRKMITESVRRVMEEGFGDVAYNPEEMAREAFDSVDGIDASEAEVDVVDKDSGILDVHFEDEGWNFWFRGRGYRSSERDLGCNIEGDVEYEAPDGNRGSFDVSNGPGSHSVTISNYFDWEI